MNEKPDRVSGAARAPTVSEQLEAFSDTLYRLMESMKRQGKTPPIDLETASKLIEKSAGLIRADERRAT